MKRVFLLCLILIFCLALPAKQLTLEIQQIASALVAEIDPGKPLFLEVRAGELSSQLESEMRKALIANGADVRESLPRPLYERDEDQADKTNRLLAYDLLNANLIQINMDIEWQTIEEKRIFSYRSTRVPVYSFEIKTIQLPQYRLLSLTSLQHISKNPTRADSANHRLKWFDPIIATAALGSLIYLLWTTE